MALARLTGGLREKEIPYAVKRWNYVTRGLKNMPVQPNEPRNWELSNDYTGVLALDLFDIGPVLGMDWLLVNNTTDTVTVVVDDDQAYTIQANQVGGRDNTKFIRLDVTPVDTVNEYTLWITGIKP